VSLRFRTDPVFLKIANGEEAAVFRQKFADLLPEIFGFGLVLFLYNACGRFLLPSLTPARLWSRRPVLMPTNETPNREATRVDDRDRHFRTDHLTKNLGGHSARAGAVTLAAQLLKFAIATAGAIVLARLLTP